MVAALLTTSRKYPSTPCNSIQPPLSPSEENTSNTNEISVSKHTCYVSSSSSSSSSSLSCSDAPCYLMRNADTPRSLSSTVTTRSLSVAFQTNFFSFQITKPKPVSQNSQKKAVITKAQKLSSISKRLDCSSEKKEQVFSSLRLLRHSTISEEKVKRATSGGDDPCIVSHTTNSEGGNNNFVSVKSLTVERGISCSDKFMVSPQKNPVENMPSVLNFRVKKAKNKIEEAHSFRLLHNRYLQWRFVNAQISETILLQRINVQEKLYNAWLTISRLHYSVRNRRIELQNMLRYAKLHFILKSQIPQLEEWSQIEKVQYIHISRIIKALTASTIRLPVISGAMVNIQDMKNAIGSAIDVMQATANSTCSLLSKAERMSCVVSEMAKIVAKEQDMLSQSKNLLSALESLHVKQSSLHVNILQLKQ